MWKIESETMERRRPQVQRVLLSHESGQGAKRTTGDGLPPDNERRCFLHLLHGLPLSPGSMELDAVPLSSNRRRRRQRDGEGEKRRDSKMSAVMERGERRMGPRERERERNAACSNKKCPSNLEG
jgi:hypothetical protein